MQQIKVGEQKLYKQFGHFSLLLIILSSLFNIVNAQSFTDFKRSQVDSFVTYTDNQDEVFNKYLKSEWEAYTSNKLVSLYKTSKPAEMRSAKRKEIKKLGPKIDVLIKNISSLYNNKNRFKAKKEIQKEKDLTLDFFGAKIEFNTPDGVRKAKFSPQTQKGIKNFFDLILGSDYQAIIDDIKKISNNLNLNDWGKYLLVKKMSEKVFSSQDNSRLFSAFIFNKLGYSIRVALAKKHIVVMYNSKNIIYSTPSYTIDNKKFYLLSDYAQESSDKIFTYIQNYPDANKTLDLSMKTLPEFEKNIKTKKLSFKQYDKEYSIDYTYNKNLIDFMATYPQVECEIFFNTPIESRTYQAIASELRKYINGKQASVAINFILNFVQNAFQYEVDSQQFGKEKIMFAQETLFYDKSDCEDRSVLFAYLIKELLGIGIVGVRYSNHISTALYIPMEGDSVKVNSKRFVIADPSYRNAIVGQNIPRYRESKPNGFIYVKSDSRRSL